MLKLRVISAIAMAVVFSCALVFLPWYGFAIFTAVVFLIGAWEWGQLAGFQSQLARVAYAAGIAGVGAGLAYWCNWLFDYEKLKPILLGGCGFWGVALLWVQGYPASAILWKSSLVRSIMGGFVLIPAWLGAVYLSHLPSGVLFILLVVAAVACADVGAYFFGRAFGKRKLLVNVSPGKSWEGVWGGVLVATILAGVAGFLGDPPAMWVAFVVVVPISLVSVLGDLLESMLKRNAGVKDSSHCIPGHGGVLDRIDGLVAAVPVFTLLLILTGWGHGA